MLLLFANRLASDERNDEEDDGTGQNPGTRGDDSGR